MNAIMPSAATHVADGRMHLSGRPCLGVTISDQARAWTIAEHTVQA